MKHYLFAIVAFILVVSSAKTDEFNLQHYLSKMDDNFAEIINLGNAMFKSRQWNYMHYEIETGNVKIGYNEKQNVPEGYVTIYFKRQDNLAYERRLEESEQFKVIKIKDPAIHYQFFEYYLNGAKALHTRLSLKDDPKIKELNDQVSQFCQRKTINQIRYKSKLEIDQLNQIKQSLRQVIREEFSILKFSDGKDKLIQQKERYIRRLKKREEQLDKLIKQYFQDL